MMLVDRIPKKIVNLIPLASSSPSKNCNSLTTATVSRYLSQGLPIQPVDPIRRNPNPLIDFVCTSCNNEVALDWLPPSASQGYFSSSPFDLAPFTIAML